MGEIVFAAKVTHVPSIWMSEHLPNFKGIRQMAIDGLKELGRRAKEAGTETFIVIDSHWITNQGFHLNARARHSGTFTSHEVPHMLEYLEYDYAGDPELGGLISQKIAKGGYISIAHDNPNLQVEYGTLVPMEQMNEGAYAKVLPIAACQFASIEEGKEWGEAIAEAVKETGRKAALIASGSLSHAFWPNRVSEQGLNSINTEFNRQVDLRVLQLWEEGRVSEFLDMLPDYAERCRGECNMIDTAMLFGALGWKNYNGKAEVIGEYFGSSGTGQVNVEFPAAAAAAVKAA